MAKAEGNPVIPPTSRGPSGFPTPGRPPAKGYQTPKSVYVPKYRTAPKGQNNPAGGAGGAGARAQFDEQCPVPKKQESQTSESQHYSSSKKKKKQKDSEQSQVEIKESFKSNKSLKKITKRALRNQDLLSEYERLKERLQEGVEPKDIRSSSYLGNGVTYVRARHGRYVIKDDNGLKDVVGLGDRGRRADMKTLANEINARNKCIV